MRSRLLPALGFVLVGLLGRAGIDKLLALKGDVVAVAEWAQISNVAELVGNVSLTGIGVALTVLSAASAGEDRLAWLKPALLLSMGLSLVVALAGLPLLLALDTSFIPVAPRLLPMALLAGWINVAPGLLVAHFLGAGQARRATLVAAASLVPPLGLLLWAPLATPLDDVLVGQILFGSVAAASLAYALRDRPAVSREALRSLLRFIPAGLAIGIMSPVATVWARTEIADHLSWHAAGQVQAIWRMTDWVTAIAAGVLNAYVLPRLGALEERQAFLRELRRTAIAVVVTAAVALAVLWLLLGSILPLLYRADIGIARQDAALFLLGDVLRVASWIGLFGLFARRSAWAVTAGEFLSLPLFALLLAAVQPARLADVGALWLFTYLVYALANGWLLRRSLARKPSSHCASPPP